MRKFLIITVMILFAMSCKKDDDTSQDYRSEAALYVVNVIANGEPITGANLTYNYVDYSEGKKKESGLTYSILDNLNNSPTYSFKFTERIKGEVRVSLAASSSSNNVKITLQLVRNGEIIREDTKQGKTLSLTASN